MKRSAINDVVHAVDLERGFDPSTRSVLCIDGRAGTGKTTLAAAVAAEDGGATVVHTDDLLPGWDGLPQLPALLAGLVEPLAAGLPGSYQRYDWAAGRLAETVVVEPSSGLVIIEGVGAGCRTLRPWRSVLAWVEAGSEVRKARALARDGDAFAPYWDAWLLAEDAYVATELDLDRIDVTVWT
ncbi:hypothetical protein ABIE44_003659 [Marmoricola sp. OAE513]|uniref:4-amino-4-deoxy-L-arabinose transferase n=1 Tax=Marmoricola sp. OAE513 TaxID=2817894 RepID=UPI001D28F318